MQRKGYNNANQESRRERTSCGAGGSRKAREALPLFVPRTPAAGTRPSEAHPNMRVSTHKTRHQCSTSPSPPRPPERHRASAASFSAYVHLMANDQ